MHFSRPSTIKILIKISWFVFFGVAAYILVVPLFFSFLGQPEIIIKTSPKKGIYAGYSYVDNFWSSGWHQQKEDTSGSGIVAFFEPFEHIYKEKSEDIVAAKQDVVQLNVEQLTSEPCTLPSKAYPDITIILGQTGLEKKLTGQDLACHKDDPSLQSIFKLIPNVFDDELFNLNG